METNDGITVILAYLRRGVVSIYTQRKLDKLDKVLGTQDWEEFIKKIKTMFSDKTKTADAKWKIRTFKQGKQNTANFIIEFKALAMKVDIDELYAIFLLKKSVQQDIIKTILEYPSIVALKLLKKWKIVVISVGQGHKSTKGRQDSKTETGMTYRGREQPIDVGKSNDNFKNGKPKCFNYNKYGHMAKECWNKKEKETQKCFKCDKEGHIAKDCK